MPDHLLGATAADSEVTIFAAVTTDLVAEIQRRHDLSPTAAAAVGRLATGAVLFGGALKGRERISLAIAGDGPIGGLTADAWLLDETTIGTRGRARNPHADLPIDARGKFDVAGVIGKGSLHVTKSYDVGQPYVGVVPLHSAEIAEDLAVYLANSEQIPSVVSLGVLANRDGVVAAGGILAQLLPGAGERAIERLEERALTMPAVTRLISQGLDEFGLLHALAGDAELRSHRSMNVRFACLCTKHKVEAALLGLGSSDLARMSEEREETEATCEYCQRRYTFTRPEIRALVDRLDQT
jgi:molecular chaperone Hsp33